MNKRENLLWKIVLIIALFAIIYNGYILYNMNNESTYLWEKYEKEDIGTDKKLQNKVERLEKSLQDKKEFKFKMKQNPSDLSAVIDFDGLNSMGIFRHFKLQSIWYSKRRGKYMAQLETATNSNYYSEKDTLAGGTIVNITETTVIFEKDGETFKYEQGED
tara:strand:+ start:58 stop:540 length:483 start_codon:yes stop_codon:yes gene_type:complete